MPILIIFALFLTPALYFLLKDFRERKPASKVLEPAPKPSIAIPQTRSQTPQKPKSETGIYEGDILDELAKTTLHILFGVMSGGGKSTSMKAIIWKIHQNKPDAKFYIVDPKTTDWLGLQRYPGTVSYLSGEVLEQLIELKRVTEQVSDILDRRITRGQNSLLAGGQVGDKEHDIYLIIDEWYSLYDSLKKLPPKLKADHGLNAISLQVNTIIAKGREHNVHLFLIAQTHLSNETGISTAMRRSLRWRAS